MKVLKIIGIALLVLIALWGGRNLGRDGGMPRPDEQPKMAPAKTRMYYCSMHPQVRSPDPNDKCPICFMDLIPLPEDHDEDSSEGDPPRLRLSRSAAALIDVRTWPAAREAVKITLPVYGKVAFDESRIIDVVARSDAYISRLVVNTPWQPVRKNGLLAELYSPTAAAAMRDLLVVRDGPPEVLAAARGRLSRLGVSKEQIDEILRRGKILEEFKVFSPVAGAGFPTSVREGEWLREGERIARVIDTTRVWINAEAYERDLPWISEGRSVQFSVAALPGRTFGGVVSFIEPVVDDKTRTVRLRIEADNSEGLFKPGMFVSAKIEAPGDSSSPFLVVPAAAPLITGKRAVVYVRLRGEEQPTFEPRRVTLGPRAGDFYVVEDGLNEGDLVVVSGQFKIDSELQIRGRSSMMTDAHPEIQEARGGEVRLQTHCPIMGGVINREFYHDHDGQRIYVCCPGCLDEVRDKAAAIIEEHRARGIVFERVAR